MGRINREDIAGAYVDSRLHCGNCLTEGWEDEVRQSDILMRTEVEESEDLIFCDECGERL